MHTTRQRRSLVAPATLLFHGDSRNDNIFSMSSIMRGSITDLDPGTYKDMWNMTSNNIEASGGDGSGDRNLSRNQRLQFLPSNASWKQLLMACHRFRTLRVQRICRASPWQPSAHGNYIQTAVWVLSLTCRRKPQPTQSRNVISEASFLI